MLLHLRFDRRNRKAGRIPHSRGGMASCAHCRQASLLLLLLLLNWTEDGQRSSPARLQAGLLLASGFRSFVVRPIIIFFKHQIAS